MREIRKVAVIGSGVMGAGIAAQVANAGTDVLLYDMTREMSVAAIDRMLKAEPKAFMSPANARRVTPLATAGDLAALADCDWIIEAIVEKPDVKRALYAEVARQARPDAVISSNTSTIRLAELTSDQPALRSRFLITHFFNPPRYMRLLEIVRGEAAEDVTSAVADFADRRMGKTVVFCRDRPGFIANRLGSMWMQAAMAFAFAEGLTVEEADAVMGRAFGIPKTGIFGLADLVGIDLIPSVNRSLAAQLEEADLFHRVNVPLPFVDRMIAEGLIGRKGKGGFYRLNRAAGKRKETIDFQTGEYRALRPVTIDDATPLLDQDNALGRYARKVWARVFAYACGLVGDAADDIAAIDAALRLGYNWRWGPFELMDHLGLATVGRVIAAEGLAGPPLLALAVNGGFYREGRTLTADGTYQAMRRSPGILLLSDVMQRGPPLLSNSSAALWDIGDGVACFALATKMNTIDAEVLDLLGKSVELAETRCKALVIGGDGPHTSAGVNLSFVASAIKDRNWPLAERLLANGQQVFKQVKYARVPVIGLAHGLALGGGCELLLHCAAIQAHAETAMGLVECGVGLIPGWGGNGEMLMRLTGDPRQPKGPMPAVVRAFELIAMATVSASAQQARELGFLRAGDGITMNRDRLLADAKARALALADGYRPPEPPLLALPGPSGATALALQARALKSVGRATDYDLVVAAALGHTLTGGGADVTRPLNERQLLDIERRNFMSLVQRPETLARILHMLETGKPLRN